MMTISKETSRAGVARWLALAGLGWALFLGNTPAQALSFELVKDWNTRMFAYGQISEDEFKAFTPPGDKPTQLADLLTPLKDSNGRYLTYGQLANPGDKIVVARPKEGGNYQVFAEADPNIGVKWTHDTPHNFQVEPRPWTTEFDVIIDGGWHCVPTSGTMVMDYWRGAPSDKNAYPFVRTLAWYLDTNDIRLGGNWQEEGRLHSGTLIRHIETGLEEYAKAEGWSGRYPIFQDWRLFSRNEMGLDSFSLKYRHFIDKDIPVLVAIGPTWQSLNHAVAAFGYSNDAGTSNIYAYDPWNYQQARTRTDLTLAANVGLFWAPAWGVPEPGVLALLGIGLAGLGLRRSS